MSSLLLLLLLCCPSHFFCTARRALVYTRGSRLISISLLLLLLSLLLSYLKYRVSLLAIVDDFESDPGRNPILCLKFFVDDVGVTLHSSHLKRNVRANHHVIFGPPQSELDACDAGNEVRDVVVDGQEAEGVVEEELLHGVEVGRRGVDDKGSGVTDCGHQVTAMNDVTDSLKDRNYECDGLQKVRRHGVNDTEVGVKLYSS